MHEFQGNSHCGVNSGVYLLHNSPSSRNLMRWWAGAGEGRCSWTGDTKFEMKLNLAEQKCANRMKAIFPKSVNVVNAGVMNMPSWYDARKHDRSRSMLVVDKQVDNASHRKCFDSNVFVCHTLGIRAPRMRKRIFNEILQLRKGDLRNNSLQRGEPYVELTNQHGNVSLWWGSAASR